MRKTPALAAALCLAAGTAFCEPKVIDPEAGFPEGPLFHDGVIYYAEYGANQVSSWDGGKLSTVWTGDGCGPSAVGLLGEDLVVTCYDNGTVARISLDGATIATYTTDTQGGVLTGPNDFTPDGNGGLYMSASGPWESGPIVGKLYNLAENGTLRLVADDLHYANGVARIGDRLYVAESEAGRVISFAIAADGSLSDRRLFVRVAEVDPGSPGAYPDGLKRGPDGNLWIGQYSAARIVVVSPDGKLVATHDLPAAAAPNMTFTPDGGTAYVTTVDDKSAAPYPGKLLELPLE